MKKTTIIVILIILIILILSVTFKKEDKEVSAGVFNSLEELFPLKSTRIKCRLDGKEHKVRVVSVKKDNEKTVVVTERKEKSASDEITIRMTYDIYSDRVVESGKHIIKGKEVSTIYPLEIIKGQISLGSSWTSADGLINSKITKIEGKKITIESVRKTEVYEEGRKTPIIKSTVETRVYEKGKGIIEYNTVIK